ncbi:hypothetical protein BDY19DRAFT_958640 [Irpex rosettiformis]|uniref:Uncharacterized protein n=1 Tax=Irpex rosettiformis TaxID=378272 RepID=A0ACB8TXP5_9APHY|nr:hypothetical protein BDY19DRAFT_958640 [Irpex rosettiformis]
MPAEKSSSQPRRSTRVPSKRTTKAAVRPITTPPTASSSSSRKARDPQAYLDHLLTHSQSKLTNIDISDVLNYENFLRLSEDSRRELCTLLPPTAFTTFKPSLDSSHPGLRTQNERPGHSEEENDTKAVNVEERSPTTLDPTVFNNSFFLSGAMTFQDHVFTGWLSKRAKEEVMQYEQGVVDGSLHAEWKDEQWAREHTSGRQGRFSSIVDLVDLAKRSLLQEGDIVTYRRTFPSAGVTVEKELLVYKINPLSHAVDFLLQPGEIPHLPKELVVADPQPPRPPILTMEGIMSSTELEQGVLDVNKQVPPELLSTANTLSYNVGSGPQDTVVASRAAKAVSIWRWRDEVKADPGLQFHLDKGGRDMLGTVFYLMHRP